MMNTILNEASGPESWNAFLEYKREKQHLTPQEDAEIRKEFSWSRWFFPNLTVDTGLKTVDAYLQEYIRYTITGRHYKGNYRIRYKTLKEWGYRNLVHEYYASQKDKYSTHQQPK